MRGRVKRNIYRQSFSHFAFLIYFRLVTRNNCQHPKGNYSTCVSRPAQRSVSLDGPGWSRRSSGKWAAEGGWAAGGPEWRQRFSGRRASKSSRPDYSQRRSPLPHRPAPSPQPPLPTPHSPLPTPPPPLLDPCWCWQPVLDNWDSDG